MYHGEFIRSQISSPSHEVKRGKSRGVGRGRDGILAIGQKVTINRRFIAVSVPSAVHARQVGQSCARELMGFQTTGTASEYFAVDAWQGDALCRKR